MRDEELLALLLRTGVQGTGVLQLAGKLLEKFGGDAAAWKVTAQYCRDLKGPNPLRWDLKQHYESTAAAYSKLLVRPITAEQLVPAVPNG